MGFWNKLWNGTAPPETANYSTLQELIIADALQNGSFQKNLALSVASVFRARELNSAVPARLPITGGGELILDTQDKVTEIILSLEDHGDAYLAVDGVYGFGATFNVLRFDQVTAQWDESQTVRIYIDRNGKRLRTEGSVPNLVVLSVNRGATDLTGIGWMESGSIQTAISVSSWVREYFDGNADPSGTYHLGQSATKDEVSAFKKQVETRNDPTRRSPLYTSGSITWEPHSFDAQSSQWVESAERTALDVSALSGVPAQFLSIALGGSNLTYTSQSELWALWYQQTAMSYISRIEQAWSGILGAEVLFDPETLLVASLEQRVRSLQSLIWSGFDPEEAVDVVGLPPIEHTGIISVQLQPQPEGERLP